MSMQQKVIQILAYISKSIANLLKQLVIPHYLALMRPQLGTLSSIGLPCYNTGIDKQAGPVESHEDKGAGVPEVS